MRGNKKVKPNRFRSDTAESAGLNFNFMESLDLCLKFIVIIVVITLVSLFFIFLHDVLTQSQYFSLNKISVSGNSRLTRAEVLKQADIIPGTNIFSINLFKVKKRLMANDWIEDANVSRKIPSEIIIKIKEEKPLAVVKLGEKTEVLINTKGIPFAEYHPEINQLSKKKVHGLFHENANHNKDGKKINIPLVKGLNLVKNDNGYGFSGRSFKSLMELLSGGYNALLKRKDIVFKYDSYFNDNLDGKNNNLNKNTCSFKFRKSIREIIIDPDMGLNIKINDFSQISENDFKMAHGSKINFKYNNSDTVLSVKMGFDKFGARYRRMEKIINYIKTNKINKRISLIDLNDLNNVTVKFENIRAGDNFCDTATDSTKGGV